MKILAIMQNMWARFDEFGMNGRFDFTRRLLFYGSLSGRRLEKAIGRDWCDKIQWAEASPQVGGHYTAQYEPDLGHIADCIRHVKPDLVITFGAVAWRGYVQTLAANEEFIYLDIYTHCAPHPALRTEAIGAELAKARVWIEQHIGHDAGWKNHLKAK